MKSFGTNPVFPRDIGGVLPASAVMQGHLMGHQQWLQKEQETHQEMR